MTVAPGQSLVCPIIVGRTTHLVALDRVLEQVRTGQAAPRAVVVSGEAGIGKSRLTAEAVTQAVQRNFAVFQGACYETDQSLPYAPLIDLLRRRASLHSIDQFAGDLGPSLTLLAQLLPELRGFLPAASIVPTTDPQYDKHRLFDALADFLVRDAVARPTLVIIEDLHWCDDLSLEFLLGLMRRSLASACLVVVTYRDTEVPTSLRHFLTTLDREHLALELTLTRFDPGDVEAMIRAIFAQSHSVRAEFVEAIHTFTDGNPFFIEEVLKSLIAAGDIYQGPGGWTRKPIGELRIPRSVHDAVAQRVQQLSKTARHVLTLAAIAGRRFPFALLAVMTDLNEADLLESLKELIAAQLVIEEAADRFAFRHELTRHAISSTLLGRERQALHRSVGEALERLAAAGLEVPIGELAYHFDAAQLWDKAFDYSRRAGEQARTLFASRAAADHFSRAIEAARQLGRELPIELLVARGEVYEVLGQFESARADFTAVLTHARFTHQRAVEWQALIDLGFLWARRDYGRAGPFFQQALSLAREMHDDALIAHSLNRVGNWHMMIEQPQAARDQHAQALAIFRALSDRPGMAETLDLMGTAGISAADMLGGREHYADAIALFRELNDRHGLASALTMAALCSGQYLDYSAVGADRDLVDESLAHAAEALAIERESDWRADEALTQIVMGLAHSVHGDYGEALAAMQAGRTIAIEIEHEQWQLNADLALGALYVDLCAWPAAVQYLEEALTLAQATGSLYWARTVTGFLASAYIAQGELDQAEMKLNAILPADRSMSTLGERHAWRAYAELQLARDDAAGSLQVSTQLAEQAPHIELRGNHSIPYLTLLQAEALIALGHTADAELALMTGLDVTTRQGVRPLIWRSHAALARLYHRRRRREETVVQAAAARDIITSLATTIPDETLRDTFLRQAEALLPASSSPTNRQAAKRAASGLTAREQAVAVRIAQGQSNRTIADELTLSERTIEKHVENIMSKWGVDTRAQIAAGVIEKGLKAEDSQHTPSG